ncbi:MAG: hypothetical protein EBY17_25020 [Acidobacteriia bacterium]|nr:hypothetical protein [Terriglobia bacterium]
MYPTTLLLSLAITGACLSAQPPVAPTPDLQLAELKKAAFLEGTWKGTGWILLQQGKREDFTQTERVVFKLGGLVLQIDGEGRKATGELIHQAFATMAFDSDGKTCHFRPYNLQGRFIDAACQVPAAGLMQWTLDLPRGQTRYTISLTPNGQWYEVGEFSLDGKEWRKTFEMTLTRDK